MHLIAAKLLSSIFIFVFSNSLFSQNSMDKRFGQIYKLSAEALLLGRDANGKLQDVRLQEFNKRMMNDNATALKTLDDFSNRLNIKASKTNGDIKPMKSRLMTGKDFDLEFLSKQIEIHKDLVGLLNVKSSDKTGYPELNRSFKNMLKRFNEILNNAINLKSSLTVKESI